VHEAFEAGRIPPWTVRGEELFTFETVEGRFTPKSVERSVQRALLAVRLLDLGPDSCNGPQSAERDVIPDTAGEPLTADWHPDPGTLPSTSRDIDLPTMEPVPTRQSPPALTLDAPSG
jgi:hypothetical protein